METKKMKIQRGSSSYVEGTFKVYTKEEWMNKGRELFGENMLKWKFVCSSCGNIQSSEEFREFKEQGATPADAYFNCIGRYIDISKDAFSDNKPCNYTMGGLITLAKTVVIDEKGKEHFVFEFADQPVAPSSPEKEVSEKHA